MPIAFKIRLNLIFTELDLFIILLFFSIIKNP